MMDAVSAMKRPVAEILSEATKALDRHGEVSCSFGGWHPRTALALAWIEAVRADYDAHYSQTPEMKEEREIAIQLCRQHGVDPFEICMPPGRWPGISQCYLVDKPRREPISIMPEDCVAFIPSMAEAAPLWVWHARLRDRAKFALEHGHRVGT